MQHRIDRLDAETWAATAVKGASKSAVADLDTFFDRMGKPRLRYAVSAPRRVLQPIKAALQLPDTVNLDRNAFAAGIWPCESTMLTLFAPELLEPARGRKRTPRATSA